MGGSKKSRKYTTEDQSDLDIKTSKNLIGDIVNMSQELNSRIWDIVNGGNFHGENHSVEKLYENVCKLSVASGIEIDRAKKEFLINTANELSTIRQDCPLTENGKSVKPHFFAHISRQKGYYNPQKKTYKHFRTSMDYLQQCVNSYRLTRSGRVCKNEFLPFSNVVWVAGYNSKNSSEEKISEVIFAANKFKDVSDSIFSNESLTKDDRHLLYSLAKADFTDVICGKAINRDTMISILLAIEKEENKKVRRRIFYALFGYPNTSFYEVIKSGNKHIPLLKENSDGDIALFHKTFSQILTEKPQKQAPY